MSICCAREAVQVEITIGDIIAPPHLRQRRRKNEDSNVPVLDITIEFVYGFVRKLDFIYLVPNHSHETPQFLRRLESARIFKLEQSSFADNLGKAYIPLNIPTGHYKLYY